MPPPPLQLHLISLGPSHYCEKARWALDRTAVEYHETRHFPGLHRLFIKKLGGGTSLPKLVVGNGKESYVLHDSTEILHFCERFVEADEQQLYPAALQQSIESWEAVFNNDLGPHVRRWAYCYLLYHNSSFGALSQEASNFEKAAGFCLLPLVRHSIYKSLGCDKLNAKDVSLGKIVEVFEKVDMELADERPFICGDSFTAADLTFAALGGPAVFPTGYGNALPALDKIPVEMEEEVRRLRQMRAGKHILQLYETLRQKVGQ